MSNRSSNVTVTTRLVTKVAREADRVRMRNGIERLAQALLANDPDVNVRLRLLAEVLRETDGSPALRVARRAAAGSRWVRLLSAEQRADGGWGRFHSCDTRAGQKTPTTEFAVARAVSLGLDVSHPMLLRAVAYLSRLLAGRLRFPDPPEKSDSWPTGVQMYAGATLARIDPQNAALDEVWRLWAEILRRTFAAGRHDAATELRAHRELTGRSGALNWLRLNNRYAVALLGARAWALPGSAERAYTRWLWEHPAGLGYLGVPLCRPPERRSPFVYDAWFTSQELLSIFPSWRKLACPLVHWLRDKCNDAGLWDFGARWTGSACFPLSDSWRSRRARVHDWSTRVLCLLARYAPT
jgi:hypothetical protein